MRWGCTLLQCSTCSGTHRLGAKQLQEVGRVGVQHAGAGAHDAGLHHPVVRQRAAVPDTLRHLPRGPLQRDTQIRCDRTPLGLLHPPRIPMSPECATYASCASCRVVHMGGGSQVLLSEACTAKTSTLCDPEAYLVPGVQHRGHPHEGPLPVAPPVRVLRAAATYHKVGGLQQLPVCTGVISKTRSTSNIVLRTETSKETRLGCSLVLPPERQQPAAIGADRQLVGDHLRNAALCLEVEHRLQ